MIDLGGCADTTGSDRVVIIAGVVVVEMYERESKPRPTRRGKLARAGPVFVATKKRVRGDRVCRGRRLRRDRSSFQMIERSVV